MVNWYVYIAECSDGTYYTGVTKDLDGRIRKHNAGKGAAYTRARKPVTFVYSEGHIDHSAALKREAEIKKMNRGQKKKLIKFGSKTVMLEKISKIE